jgi:hydrogenase maturation protease
LNGNSKKPIGETKTTLVIGVGNLYRSDDGAGIVAARKLQAMNLSFVRAIEESGEGTSLIEAWKGFTRVIIIDATSSGSPPGTIHKISVQEETTPSRFFHYSSHAFGVAEGIELARVLGRLPSQCVVFGIEGGSFVAGSGLSFEVSAAVDKTVAAVLEICGEYVPV